MLFPINPYGRSKLFIEHMIKDTATANKNFRIALLRYIHITDIAQGQIIVLNVFEKENEKLFNGNTVIYNMGTNKGFSVKEVMEMYEKANGIKLNYSYGERRSGDATISLS